MSRFSRALLLALAVILLTGTIAFGYTYRSQVSISNNTSTVYPMLSVNWTANNQWMEDNGFFGAGANTTRVQTLGGLNKPHMVSDTRTLIAIPVPANSQSNLYFVTGESAQSMKIITGRDGYLTTSDSANLEHSNNFTDTITGYFDATAVGNLISKAGAYDVSGDGSGNITASILGGLWQNLDMELNSDWLTGAGTTTQSNTQAHGGTYSWKVTGTNGWAYQDYVWSSIYQGANVTISVWVWTASGSAGKIGIDDGVGVTNSAYHSGNSTWQQLTVSRVLSVSATRLRLMLMLDGATTSYFDDAVAPPLTQNLVSVTGMASGEPTIRISKNSQLFGVGASSGLTANIPVDTSLLLNYPFWQSSSLTSVDSTQRVLLVAGGSPTWSSQGWVFNGTSDYFTSNSTSMPSGAAARSYEAWIYPTDVSSIRTILGNDDSGAGLTTDFMVGRRGVGTLGLEYGNGGYTTAVGTIVNNTWQHVAVTFSGSNPPVFYVNGVVVASSIINTPTMNTSYIANFRVGLSSQAAYYWKGTLGELRVYTSALSASQVLVNYNASKWKYLAGYADVFNYAASTVSVPDNASPYLLAQDNVMPYIESLEMTVGGNQQLYYAPNAMIISDTLPDRGSDATSNPATITWGTNPVGVTVSVGSMTSSGQPTIGAVTPDPTRDSLPVAGGGDWNIEPDVSGTLLANPFRPIIIAVSDNTSLTERQTWVWSGIAFVVMVFGVAARGLKGHVGLAGVATGIALVINIVMTIFPIIVLPLAILLIVGGLISERSPSL